MIHSLRKKFIFINMLLVFIILVVIFSYQIISTLHQLETESLTAMQMVLERKNDQAIPNFKIGEAPSVSQYNRSLIFVIGVTQHGNFSLIYTDNISISDEEVRFIAETVLSTEEKKGILPEYNLRFLCTEEGQSIKIALMERSAEQQTIKNTFLNAFLSGTLALIGFFLVSLFLSRWALKPVETAWYQQRRFIADASHELKTPLTVILANAGILKTNPDHTVQEEMGWIESTEQEAKRMKKLVDELLFLAKSDDAIPSVPYQTINLSDITLNTALTFESMAFEHDISLETDNIAPDVRILGDESRIKQLLGILLDNAVKYADRNDLVTVSLEIRQSRAVLGVHNTGSFIPEKNRAHIFDRFYREDQSRSKEGYGLGLSIAKSIAESHKGKIAVDSDEKGTLFFIAFPIASSPI